MPMNGLLVTLPITDNMKDGINVKSIAIVVLFIFGRRMQRKQADTEKQMEAMKQTGHDIPSLYKETSEGGLATNYSFE